MSNRLYLICETSAFSGTLRSALVGFAIVATMFRGSTNPAAAVGAAIAVCSKNREGCPVAGTCRMRCPKIPRHRTMSVISFWYRLTSTAPGPIKSAAACRSRNCAFMLSFPEFKNQLRFVRTVRCCGCPTPVRASKKKTRPKSRRKLRPPT